MECSGEKLYVWGEEDEGRIRCPIGTSIVLFVLNYCENSSIRCHVVRSGSEADRMHRLPLSCFPNIEFLPEATENIKNCTLPAIQKACMIRTGLCAVLRHIIKTSDATNSPQGLHKLLGYKGICLKSCAEVSVWTKFCEIEMPQCIEDILENKIDKMPDIPEVLIKLENHMGQPPIIPNISKRKRQIMRKNKSVNGLQQDTMQKTDKQEDLEHVYAEGTDMTLTDLVLYPCVTCFLARCKEKLSVVQKALPRVCAWYRRLQAQPLIKQTGHLIGLPTVELLDHMSELLVSKATNNTAPQPALDVRDPYKKKFKAHASQVNNVIEKLEQSGIHAVDEVSPWGPILRLHWEDLPPAAHPAQGELPDNRVARKCEQLENLVRAVMHMAEPGHVIVDFCSGGGHLGIVLAYLLPHCKVILVENKEESIVRAEKRIQTLGLDNIMLYQCNMDYFVGTFDIGVCLHACGVATDLVLKRCLDIRAAFVICPCCYGGIQTTHTMTYPRSATFVDKRVTYEDYLTLGHAADQTQVGIKQAGDGKKCMLLIDTDRAMSAREKGYRVTLCSLQPLSCSPKNNLLIGRPDA